MAATGEDELDFLIELISTRIINNASDNFDLKFADWLDPSGKLVINYSKWKESRTDGHYEAAVSQSKHLFDLYKKNVGEADFNKRISTLATINKNGLMRSLLKGIDDQLKKVFIPTNQQLYSSNGLKTSTNHESQQTKGNTSGNFYSLEPKSHDRVENKKTSACASDTLSVKPIKELTGILGRKRGIKGHYNSSCIDATFFSMFAFTSKFDEVLYGSLNEEDNPKLSNIRHILREEIVHPLRKDKYVGAEKMLLFRSVLEDHTSDKGFICEERDPEELLTTVLERIFNIPPYLEMSSGQTSHLCQLLVMPDLSTTKPPTVQELFDKSFETYETKLKKIPRVLILQMPRFGAEKVFSQIIPSPQLSISHVIENEILSSLGPKRVVMELFAIVCIDTAHYVSFVKCGSGTKSSWCFF